MNKYTLRERDVLLDDSWDVIVAGGGPAGCAAAAAAAREGAKTLLIEATGALGGMGTSGLVPAWCPFTDKNRIIYGGMAEQILRQCISGMPHVPKECFDWIPIDAELLKRIYDDLVTQQGVTVLFNTLMTGVECDATGHVDAILVAGKSGLTAHKAKVYIDATGDADLAAWAGAAYNKGDAKGDLQPATHCFTLTNVDMYAYQHCGSIKFGADKDVIDDIVASGKYPEIPDTHACSAIIGPGAIGFNAGHIWSVDNTNPFSSSKALMQGRKIAKAFRDACAEFFPKAFANAHLTQTASLLGIRETRRIVGDYVLTLNDYSSRRSFSDEICRNSYFIDIHIAEDEAGSGSHITAAASQLVSYKQGESHGIPYRCLTPKGLSNVLVAGRCISTDRSVQGSTRIMPVCLCTGEAAGIAATMAARADIADVHAVDTDTLRRRIRDCGAYLPEIEAPNKL
ncbi:MAG: FAD-dependent oxidoreductase [Kiritimatiellaceae bacterium]|nr:FAD-dependent oxidoreductase [Kiritimatiellaceae bacterium]